MIIAQSGPGKPHTAQSKQALLLNSQFSGEKEATISDKAGEARAFQANRFLQLSPRQPLACESQVWSVRREQCAVINYSLQTAAPLIFNYAHKWLSDWKKMECMGRTVVDFYVCLVGSVEAGEWHLKEKEVAGSRCVELGKERGAIPKLRGALWYPPFPPRFALGSKRREITLPTRPWWVCVSCLFLWIHHSLLRMCLFLWTHRSLHTWKFTTDLAAAWISLLGITKALFPG